MTRLPDEERLGVLLRLLPPAPVGWVRAAQELFDLRARGVIGVRVGQTYPLQAAARAHGDLEARRTTGSTVLVP